MTATTKKLALARIAVDADYNPVHQFLCRHAWTGEPTWATITRDAEGHFEKFDVFLFGPDAWDDFCAKYQYHGETGGPLLVEEFDLTFKPVEPAVWAFAQSTLDYSPDTILREQYGLVCHLSREEIDENGPRLISYYGPEGHEGLTAAVVIHDRHSNFTARVEPGSVGLLTDYADPRAKAAVRKLLTDVQIGKTRGA